MGKDGPGWARVGKDEHGCARMGKDGQGWARMGRDGQGWARLGKDGQGWAWPSDARELLYQTPAAHEPPETQQYIHTRIHTLWHKDYTRKMSYGVLRLE